MVTSCFSCLTVLRILQIHHYVPFAPIDWGKPESLHMFSDDFSRPHDPSQNLERLPQFAEAMMSNLFKQHGAGLELDDRE